MRNKKPLVGFERHIELDWLNKTANWVIEKRSTKEIHGLIDEFLEPLIKGDTSRRKTKNVLSGAWVKSGSEEREFKALAEKLYIHSNRDEKIAIHFGMLVASYPFFYELSKIAGRLFRLQDSIPNDQFYHRVVQVFGDRDSIKRAAARYLQSLSQWGLLNTADKSVIKTSKKVSFGNPELITWMLASVFFSLGESRLTIEELKADPAWFPFEINTDNFKLGSVDFLEVLHQGYGNTVIGLKKQQELMQR